MRRFLAVAAVTAALCGCKSDDKAPSGKKVATGEPAAAGSTKVEDEAAAMELRDRLTGMFRAVLTSPGGELPFGLEFVAADGRIDAFVHNAEERSLLSGVDVKGNQVTLRFDHYDARIVATWDATEAELVGEWSKTTTKGKSTLPFSAKPGAVRFPLREGELAEPNAGTEVTGRWKAVFRDDESVTLAVGEFVRDGTTVTGTFLTETGDYRYLEGVYRGTELRLSTFDGAHAFLFVAQVTGDGRLRGEFWSRDVYRATFIAERVPAGTKVLASGFAAVKVKSRDRKFRFSFEDVDGNTVTQADKRFAGKALIVDIFGTWCPNCNDAAPQLAKWHRAYRDKGLEVVGLAFEFSGDVERDRRMLREYQKRHSIEYPLLLAGVSDKQKAGALLPDISAVKAYPTTVFIGRNGVVRRIHSGFAGPGTGDHHKRLIAELDAIVANLIK